MTRLEVGLLGIVLLLVSAMAGLVVTHGNPFASTRTSTTTSAAITIFTHTPNATSTATAASTHTPTATYTATAASTSTPTATSTATPTSTPHTGVLGLAVQIRYIDYTGGLGIRVRFDCADDSPGAGAWSEGTRVDVVDSRADCPGWLKVQRSGGETSWVRTQYLSDTAPSMPPPTATLTPTPLPTDTPTPPPTDIPAPQATATPTEVPPTATPG